MGNISEEILPKEIRVKGGKDVAEVESKDKIQMPGDIPINPPLPPTHTTIDPEKKQL